MVKNGNVLILVGIAVGVVLIFAGLYTFGGIDRTVFEGIFGFSLIDINSSRLFCTETTCIWNWRDNFPITSRGILKEKIDLGLININEPIIVKWRIDIKSVQEECKPLLRDLRMQIEINDGADMEFITIGSETKSTNIQPFINTNEGELEIAIGTEFCIPIDDNKISYTISNGDLLRPSAPTITFTKFGAERPADQVLGGMMGISECRDAVGKTFTGQDCSFLSDFDPRTIPVCGCKNIALPSAKIATVCDFSVLNNVFVFDESLVDECKSPTKPKEQDSNASPPSLTISTGVATKVFVILGVILIGVAGFAIYMRRKSSPITEF